MKKLKIGFFLPLKWRGIVEVISRVAWIVATIGYLWVVPWLVVSGFCGSLSGVLGNDAASLVFITNHHSYPTRCLLAH